MATLDFKGKSLVQNYHLSVKYHELVPKRDKSLTDKVRLDDNLIIHGDNLKALKALLPTYAGKVKCIYIDPPYNTGNEGWAYNDNVNSPMLQDWFAKTVDRDDQTRHDKWLCMMMPRLKLLRELLCDDGAIFISIDDNEVHRLMCMMDEVFGTEQFLGLLPRRTKAGGGSAASHFAIEHDYVLVFAKRKESISDIQIEHDPEYAKRYSEQDDQGKYYWDTFERSYTQTTPYVITAPDGTKLKGDWFRSEKRFNEDVKKGEIRIRKKTDGNWSVQFKQRMSEGRKLRSLLSGNEFRSDPDELEQLGIKFDYPKPVVLLTHLLSSIMKKDSIVLDSFAGSGTTAQALLTLNKKDGGKRKFILVECEDYADDITAERVRRVIKGVKGASDENLKKGLGGTFSYFELGKAIELDSILDGKNLPSYLELARYVFYTATGEEFDERKVNEKRSFVGESNTHEVYLFYQPDMDYLKKTALTLERAENLGKIKDKRRLVFAPTKYLDQEQLDALRIDFAQLPFEIYKLAQ
jgi:adenine-specific DNA-methyltransferase